LTTVLLSVVVASRNRPALLARLLEALGPQLEELAGRAELIVVDDGSTPPYAHSAVGAARLVRTGGLGPARARNRGAREARGEVVAFTDDDVVVEPGWVAAILDRLAAEPAAAGVSGDTSSPPYNPLYEHSVEDRVGRSFLTCNVAYRRAALEAVGGFDERFSHAHEDWDLGQRIEATVGAVLFEPAMRVVHPGRPFGVRAAARRAHFIYDDWLLFARYPQRLDGRHSARFAPVFKLARTWRHVARTQRLGAHPVQLARWLVVSTLVVGTSAWLALWRWRALADRDASARPGLRCERRVAYVGPSPHPAAGGAPGVAGLLLAELLVRGYQVDCFVAASVEDDDPRGLGERPGLGYVVGRSGFAFGRWYSRHRLTKMISSQLFAAHNRRRLARRLAALHRASPYDLVYQFSTFESFGVPRRRRGLAVIIHPSVHAAGERRWVLREARSRPSDDSALRTAIVAAWLGLRARRQRRDARRATGVLALSSAFAAEVVADYGLDGSRVRVVGNCVDLAAIRWSAPRTRELAVVGRVAVRKGLEDVVALSHRIDRLEGVRLRVIGAPSLWSDYRRTLRGVDPAVSTVEGGRARAAVLEEVGGALALLQLSRYEPFGLTVAEALALGVPVVVTAAVGAAEALADDVKVVVAPGDIDALVEAVASIAALREDERLLLSHRCRHEAERCFAPAVVADALVRAFDELLS
jgi:glycosyltransferase involved in cell wall biosynthesis/GT2 family glycosyltransferase